MVTVSLSDFPGTVQVRFRIATDTSVQSGGWWIDDIAFSRMHINAVVGHIIGRLTLSPSQKLAADRNSDGKLDTIDVLMP
jgi:hypothetical protein